MPHDFRPWFQVGVLLARQNQPPAAQANLRAARQRRPGLVEGWVELGRCQASASQWADALDAFEHALDAFARSDGASEQGEGSG